MSQEHTHLGPCVPLKFLLKSSGSLAVLELSLLCSMKAERRENYGGSCFHCSPLRLGESNIHVWFEPWLENRSRSSLCQDLVHGQACTLAKTSETINGLHGNMNEGYSQLLRCEQVLPATPA